MFARHARRIAAGATAVALTGLGLVGVASGANAVDNVSPSPKFGGSFSLASGNTFADYTEGSSVIPWGEPLVALKAPGNISDPVGSIPASGANLVYQFLAPQGQESNINAWNAYTSTGLLPNGQLLENVSPLGLLNAGLGSPAGQAAVAAAGGDFSLGWAYTDSGKLNVANAGLYYVHIHVTAGTMSTATYTYTSVAQQAVTTPTTTAITTAPTTVASGATFSLTATVSAPTATGTVTFKNGATTIGTAPVVAGGTATLATAAIANATASSVNASVTAVYSGDSAFGGSTSAASTIAVTPGPIATTTAVTATSNSGEANRPVVLTANVAPVGSAGAGSVVFTAVNGASTITAGPIPVNASGVAAATISTLGAGAWTVNAAFTGTAPYQSSASTTAAALSLTAVSTPVDQRTTDAGLTVTIPAGTLTITTPWTVADPLDLGTATLDDATSTYFTDPTEFGSATDQSQAIQVIDRRAGAPGFTAQVKSTDFTSGANTFPAKYLGLINLGKHQVTGNTLQAGDVTVTSIPANSPGLSGTAQTFATYGAGHATGTAWISGDVQLKGIPSSVQAGLYKATLTFTVL